MAPKRKKPIAPAERPMFVTWDDDKSRALALREAGNALKRVEPIVRSHGTNIYMDVAPNNVSVRDGFSRQDYDSFRTEGQIPTKPKAIIKASMDAYDNIGVIRNVIDLMGDFATQGIDLNHPNERIEKWYKEWWRRIKGKERSERFLNLLYRTGNVVVKRHTAKLTVRQEEQMRRSQADPDVEIPAPPQMLKREVPWRYTFFNPLSVEVMADELAVFLGQDDFVFAVKVPATLAKTVKEPKGATQKALVKRLPANVVEAIRAGKPLIPLDPEKTKGFYYKRDDWQTWANPMVHAILSDLQLLQKMKLADMAALDGAISCIRVWKLGNIDAKIIPTEVAIQRLAEMLTNNVGGGVMDLVWDAAIELLETSTDVHQFLGSTKYEPVLTSIYAGLGIPPTLTGATASGGFTNNFISLKTLTERLQYGRDVLTAFWEEEIRLVQKSMGFRFPANLVFDRMTLSDESAEKQLLINLADRDIISWESVVERFDETPEIEQVRLRREARKRREGQMPEKASPFHTPNKDHDMKKAFVGQGTLTPGQVGLELDDPKDGEKTLIEQQNEQATKDAKLQMKSQQMQNDHQFRTDKTLLKHGAHPNQVQMQQQGTKPKGQPGQGRPKQSKDATKRKQKKVVPRTSATFFQTMAWAENAQAKIGQFAGPYYLKSLGKKTMRDLTDDEASKFERYKFFLLCQLEPNQVVDESTLRSLSKAELSIPAPVDALLRETVGKYVESNGREPSLDVVRRYQAGCFALWNGDFADAEEEAE